MLEINFEYKDIYSMGKWCKQSCITTSVQECIKFYGLDQSDVEYHILSVKEC